MRRQLIFKCNEVHDNDRMNQNQTNQNRMDQQISATCALLIIFIIITRLLVCLKQPSQVQSQTRRQEAWDTEEDCLLAFLLCAFLFRRSLTEKGCRPMLALSYQLSSSVGVMVCDAFLEAMKTVRMLVPAYPRLFQSS